MTIQPLDAEPTFVAPSAVPAKPVRRLDVVPEPDQPVISLAELTGFDMERFGCIGYNAAGLPIVPKSTAIAAGLLPIGELARYLGRTPDTIKRWIADGAAPGPVAVQKAQTGGGHHRLLFSREEYAEHETNRRVRSRPPVRIGTRTSAASGPYRWRDPVRWNHDSARSGARP